MIQVREQYGNIYVKVLADGPSFDYILEKLLVISGRVYIPDKNEWMFGKEVLHELLFLFENQIIWVKPLKEIVGDYPIQSDLVKKHIAWAESDIFSDFKLQPYPYQKVAAYFLASKGQGATFDGVGLGKSVTLIGASHILFKEGRAKRTLIVTLNNIKGQWAREVGKFTDYKAIAAIGTKSKRMKILKDFQHDSSYRFLVINYEMLRDDSFMEIILNSGIDIVGLDEAQMIKSGIEDSRSKLKQSEVAKGAYRLKSIPYRFIATATPVQNKAEEIFSLFYFVNDKVLGEWKDYMNQFCNVHHRFGVTGSKNLHLLYQRISPWFIRRTKEMPEIQQQLPKTSHSRVYLPMTATQKKIEDAIREELEQLKESQKSISGDTVINGKLMSEDEQDEYYSGLAQGMLNFLLVNLDLPAMLLHEEASSISKRIVNSLGLSDKELNKSPKLDHMSDYISQIIHDEPSSKIVIFTEFAKIADYLHSVFSQYSVLYTGQVSESMKEHAVNSFINDPNCRIFISTSAGSTGLNLQVANYMIHYDMPFNPTEIEQRNGRIDRTGNPFPNLNFIYYIMEDSYEEDLLKTLSKKSAISSNILYGE